MPNMPVHISDFSCGRTVGRTGPTEVVQEVLVDLKSVLKYVFFTVLVDFQQLWKHQRSEYWGKSCVWAPHLQSRPKQGVVDHTEWFNRFYACIQVGAFMALSKDKFHLRTEHSKLLGYWTVELGGLNQVVPNHDSMVFTRQTKRDKTKWDKTRIDPNQF